MISTIGKKQYAKSLVGKGAIIMRAGRYLVLSGLCMPCTRAKGGACERGVVGHLKMCCMSVGRVNDSLEVIHVEVSEQN